MKGFLFYEPRGAQSAVEVDESKNSDKGRVVKAAAVSSASASKSPEKSRNSVRKIRESLLMSKAELARKAGLSVLTVGRIENGVDCRMDTKRKLILALGLTLEDKEKVFPGDSSLSL